MQRNRARLLLGHLLAGNALDDSHAGLAELVLVGVDEGNLAGQRVLDHDAPGKAIRRELQVVGEHEVEVGVEFAIQLALGHAHDVEGGLEHLRADGRDGLHQIIVYMAEHPLDARLIGKLVGNGGKTDALAEDNKLVALSILRHCHAVVDLLGDEHVVTPQMDLNRTTR